MPLVRPTLAQLRADARADFVARLPSLDGQLRRSIVNAVADVLAGMVFLLYGFLVWLSTQLLPDTATGVWLARWLAIKGITQTAAVAWVGNYNFAGTINGAVIAASTVLQRGDGALYTTNAAVTLASGIASVAITAATPGADGNCASGVILTLVTAISGIAATGTVGSTITTGADAETAQAASQKLLLALRTPAQGGSKSDYLQWALTLPQCTRAWVYPLASGAGTVTVLFAVDGESYGPIPNSSDIAQMQTLLNGLAPVTAVVTAGAIGANAVNFTIANLTVLSGFTTAAVQANIQAALIALFQQQGAPGGAVQLQAMSDAITRAAGVAGFDLSAPTADVTSGSTSIPVVGTITW